MNIIIFGIAPLASDVFDAPDFSGCHIEFYEDFNEGLEKLKVGHYGLAVLAADKSALKTKIHDIRRHSEDYIYISILSSNPNEELNEITAVGGNYLFNTIDFKNGLSDSLQNARRLADLMNIVSDETQDFPSAGGVIARSAFNQLFLSCLERGQRYSERTSILCISIENYKELYKIGGSYVADYHAATLSKTLVDIARQSDIIGQIKHEFFALLFLRPLNEQEPLSAAQRFHEVIKNSDIFEGHKDVSPQISISLIEIPTGRQMASFICMHANQVT